ncbi:Metallo-peptidase family M12-domain-containing protein [Fennellomyces sp. T-0311]|nr:Metallo-peptidase family M12-domain-containing protein [Fennellomyces sp. T-0311]
MELISSIWFLLLLTNVLLFSLPVSGHSVRLRKLSYLEPLRDIQFEVTHHPKKHIKKSESTPDAGYTTDSHAIGYSDNLRLTLHIYNQTVHLHLTPNFDLFHPNAVTWQDRKDTPITHDQLRIYRGHVIVGDMESEHCWKRDSASAEFSDEDTLGWARIIVRQDLTKPGMDYPIFEGSFTMHGDMYHIKTSANYKLSKNPDDVELTDKDASQMIIYRDSDTTLLAQGSTNQVDKEPGLVLDRNSQLRHPVLRVGHPAARELGMFIPRRMLDPTGTLTKRHATNGCPTSTQSLYIGVAADCTYTKRYGSPENARIQIINNLNTASAVYERTFNIQLALMNITIMHETCPSVSNPNWNQGCSEAYTMEARLYDFSKWRSTTSDDGLGLWHLMTNCITATSVIGLSWYSQVCNTGLIVQELSDGRIEYVSGTSMSTADSIEEWKTLAHEIAHTFGAHHDCVSGDCPCDTSDCTCCPLSETTCDTEGKYIMNPRKNSTTNSFSPCSIAAICSQLPSIGSCLEAPGGRSVQTLLMCGNGIKEDGEDCDPGGKETTCCDPQTCKFINDAVCDDATDGCCSNCQIKPVSHICREASGECDVPEYCDGISGDCPSDKFLDDGLPCGGNNSVSTGLQCAFGQCILRDE